eukprot:10161557-Lingulodinium_polyedra.AAC.1
MRCGGHILERLPNNMGWLLHGNCQARAGEHLAIGHGVVQPGGYMVHDHHCDPGADWSIWQTETNVGD